MIPIAELYLNKALKSGLTVKPTGCLKDIISHYSFSLVRVSHSSEQLGIIPDASGCMVFMIDDYKMDAVVWGPTTEVTFVDKAGLKPALMFMIEFLQGGLKYFVAESQKDLKNKIVKLTDINRELNTFIQNLYAGCECLECFLVGVESYLIQQLMDQYSLDAFQYSVQLIKSNTHRRSVLEIAQTVNYSDRQLQRIYNDRLGMGVKSLMNLVRVNRIISLMKSEGKGGKTLFADQDYYDQAHFINAFKDVCGVTPKVFSQNMSDFYNEKLKF